TCALPISQSLSFDAMSPARPLVSRDGPHAPSVDALGANVAARSTGTVRSPRSGRSAQPPWLLGAHRAPNEHAPPTGQSNHTPTNDKNRAGRALDLSLGKRIEGLSVIDDSCPLILFGGHYPHCAPKLT